MVSNTIINQKLFMSTEIERQIFPIETLAILNSQNIFVDFITYILHIYVYIYIYIYYNIMKLTVQLTERMNATRRLTMATG